MKDSLARWLLCVVIVLALLAMSWGRLALHRWALGRVEGHRVGWVEALLAR